MTSHLIQQMNLSGFLYLSSLMLLTWYLISISHIPSSSVYFYCFDYIAAAHSKSLYTFNRDIFFLVIFYLFFLFQLNPSFHALFMEFSFQFLDLNLCFIFF